MNHNPGTDWEAVTAWATVALAVLGSGAIYQLFDNRRSRNTETVQRIGEHWHSKQIVKGRKLVRQHPTNEDLIKAVRDAQTGANGANKDDYYVYLRLLDFFEEIGLSHSKRSRGFASVNRILGTIIIDAWEIWEPVIGAVWADNPRAYENFRKLEIRLQKTRHWSERRQKMLTAAGRFLHWATSSDYGRYN